MVHERGAALLITLVLITVIGSIAFGVGRSSLTNFRLITRLEDSLNAYQAAQAGIEDSLLRFRFSKNSELPAACPSATNQEVPTKSTNWFERVNVTTGARECVDLDPDLPVPTPNSSDIVYDLKMYYRKDAGRSECVVSSPTTEEGCLQLPIALAKDATVEYSVQGMTSLTLTATFESQDTTPPGQRKIEVLLVSPDGQSLGSELYDAPGGQVTAQPIPLSGQAVSAIRIRPFGKNLVRYELQPRAGESIDSRVTTIESVGYFGVSKRKLTLTLDRTTGTIFELFDFVLFAGSSGISPTP